MKYIIVKGAREHNLKNVNVSIPKNTLTVVTGVSGSGKSSLAFNTIYSEGQRRYVESLSVYARQFLDAFNKPDVDLIEGLSPAIAIEQKTTSSNPRSTVGTITEIYDYLRLLFARIGTAYSPVTNLPIEKQTIPQMVNILMDLPEETKLYILAPIIRSKKGEYKKVIDNLIKKGFERFKINGKVYNSDNIPSLNKNQKHTITVIVDRIVIKKSFIKERLFSSLETTLKLTNGIASVEVLDNNNLRTSKKEILFSENLSCPISGFVIEEIEPRLFSFNNPFGACRHCNGLGVEAYFDVNLIVPDSTKQLKNAIAPFNMQNLSIMGSYLHSFCEHYKVNILTPFNKVPKDVQQKLMYGTQEESIEVNIKTSTFTHKTKKPFEGIINILQRRLKEASSEAAIEHYKKFQTIKECHECKGARLNKKALQVKVANLNISEVTNFSISKCLKWFQSLEKTLPDTQQQIAKRILKEILQRLKFLNNIGIGYLNLSRSTSTLSGGETQRIRLASQIGCSLTGVLYVLDEPSIGLHQKDNDKLIDTLFHLKHMDNTIIVVEHDEDTIRAADYVIDMGPLAGVLGGEIIAKGTPEEIVKNDSSLTGKYLSGKLSIKVPSKRRLGSGKFIKLTGAKGNNLKSITVQFPLGTLTCVSGVSGSGKSTLVNETLYKAVSKILNKSNHIAKPYESIEGLEYIDKVVYIDQSPIGRMPTSNPATYTKVFDLVRNLFSELPEAKAKGYKSGRFSFNVKGGRCERCEGNGVIKIEMHFLPEVFITCEECKGKRYNEETLEVKFKSKSIADILDMTVSEAVKFFANVTSICSKVIALKEVGLEYIKLGQPATTLSGGEAQRVKLAKELAKKATGNTLYILDEPTTGLHFHDINQLLNVLHRLVDKNNTVIVIEHNLDVLKNADYILDIGKEGGTLGGEVVAQGTPEEVASSKDSYTGMYLKKVLKL